MRPWKLFALSIYSVNRSLWGLSVLSQRWRAAGFYKLGWNNSHFLPLAKISFYFLGCYWISLSITSPQYGCFVITDSKWLIISLVTKRRSLSNLRKSYFGRRFWDISIGYEIAAPKGKNDLTSVSECSFLAIAFVFQKWRFITPGFAVYNSSRSLPVVLMVLVLKCWVFLTRGTTFYQIQCLMQVD